MPEGCPVPRAHRFPIETPIKYRHVGSPEWYEGKTLNISTSGIRFRAPQLLERNSPVEMDLIFHPGSIASPPVHLICEGCIVDTIAPRSPDQLPAMSANIRSYSFLRPEPGPEDPLLRRRR